MFQIANCNYILPVMAIFEEKYVIKNKDILLSSIEVCGLKETSFDKDGESINFEIKNISDTLTIYPLQKADKYFIRYGRLVDKENIEMVDFSLFSAPIEIRKQTEEFMNQWRKH